MPPPAATGRGREALVREMGPFLSFLRVAALESGRQVPYGGRTRKRLLTSPRFHLLDVGVRNVAAEAGPSRT